MAMKLLALFVLACAALGCSQQSKDEYKAAGGDIVKAGKETGKAISADLDKAGAETKEEVHKAKGK